MKRKFLYPQYLNVFFVGIGGISMRGLAKLLIYNGYVVSGSDKANSPELKELEALGAKVYYSHQASNVDGADLVVYSSAIRSDNPEICRAKEKSIPTIKRSVLLGKILSEYRRSVAISGCHGKTTATAMLSQIMISAGQSPTVFLGGEYSDYGNLLVGSSDLAIAEACEYKKSFLDIRPKIAVVLNIDNDHLDSFDGMKDVVASFKEFVGDNLAVINADEKYINEISNCTTVTFGIENVATYYAKDIKETCDGISFIACAYAKPYGKINLPVKGKHNVYNALSAFATADLLGASFSAVKKGLEAFKGVKRRNEFLGEANGLKFFADYAHHPSEIKATLSAFKRGGEDFITVFQPHTYSRTRLLMNEFVEALSGLENLVVYKTYPAREKFDGKGSALKLKNNLVDLIADCSYVKTQKELISKIKSLKEKGKYKRVVFLGAGDIYQIAGNILRQRTKL